MSLRTRKILFIIFVLAFFIITPLAISYAAGYKIVLSKKILQKTGTLALNSIPTRTKIYIDGEPRQFFFKKYTNKLTGKESKNSYVTTPAKIKNLLPGEYNVKLEQDGYWAWEKKLTVQEGITTFAENIHLFKRDLPLLLQQQPITKLSVAPNQKFAISVTANKIYLLTLPNADIISEVEFIPPQEEYEIIWSDDMKKIIIGNKIFLLDNLTEFKLIVSNNAKKIKFGPNKKIYYITGGADPKTNRIENFDPSNNTASVVTKADGEITDYLIKNNNLYFLNQISRKSELHIIDLNSAKEIKIIELPAYANFTFLNPDHHLINLYDNKHEILYLIDPFSHFPLRETVNNVKHMHWVNNDLLLYGNDFEIWILNFNDGRKTLLTRISSPISKAIWHPSNNYIIYATDQAIYTLELDERDKRNLTEIIKLDAIKYPHLSAKGDILYFYAKVGGQEGLYKLATQ